MRCQFKTITCINVIFYCDNNIAHMLSFSAPNLDDAIKQAHDKHDWHINQTSFPARKATDINEVLCPTCYKKRFDSTY